MNKIIINIHSTVQLITNSSSEIFVNADKSTVDGIKVIIDNLLAIGGSTLKSDDLFDVYLEVYDYNSDDYVRDGSEEAKGAKTENYDGMGQSNVSVKVKDGVNNEFAEKAAKLLTHLDKFFQFDAIYNG